ncbi:mycobactin polyketide synthase MbtD [Candidatus Mycobacterium wuenschmannii]|uniref:Mycobactin polyketide synthase MbtD n=1 Tax=Candidatus Mycobacterium wuenschmannii TaxID=3027808 RepID=A0ABY8W4K7_9MYCO|nr:mycobactin polyketide synthase MbtD [Candidatus Mycobacterium wuenschmannii]WIM89392.1 mycobactin polyketide synthase MbtD [Candidatus Mycobacterium wuenschmannii]
MLAQPLPDGRVPILLSAHDERLIGQDAWAILDFVDRLDADRDPTVEVAATVQRLRRVRRHRAVVRAADRAELVAALAALAHDEEHPLVARSSKSVTPSAAFVFPGQGNQWQSMGVEAYGRLAAYRAEADRCAEAFVAAGYPSPLPYLQGDAERDWSRVEIQGAQFTHAVSLAAQWKFSGVLPAITVGHSLGEIAAAYVAEKISLADAAALVGARATVVGRLTGHYAMVVLGLAVDDAQALIGETPGWLEVSAVNGPSATVVSGDHDAVVAVTASAQAGGVFAQKLIVDYPGHTSALRPLGEELAALQPRSAFVDGPMAFIGSAIGAEVGSDVDFSQYWYESLCSTVRFDRAVVAAQKCGADAFIEMSAHPSLLYPLNDLVVDDSAVILGSGHRDGSIVDVLSGNIAAAAVADPHYPWAAALPADTRAPVRGFPNAPMRAVHLWAAPEPMTTTLVETANPLTVAIEDWQPADASTPAAPTRCAIAIVGDDGGHLSAAASAHRGYEVVSPTEAEIVAVLAPTLDALDATEAVAQIAGRSDVGLPDYTAIIGPRCRAVWLLTAAGEHVLPGDPAARPAQAALAAMHRSVAFEFGDQTFGTLDLPAGEIDVHIAVAALDVLLGDAGVLALRGSEPLPFVRTLRETREPATARGLDAAALENVVITGGSGAIGLRYAQHCIERGARRVILLSRNGIAPDVLEGLIGRHHVEVHAPRCDITDRVAVGAVAAEYAGAGASLLIHTAGIASASLRDELTGPDVAAVCAAKVAGLAAMADGWPLQPECRILACSSVFGVWGGHGHAAYAASNRILDVLAAQLRATGLDCTAIRWGLWQDAGVVEAAEIARTERSGLIAMRPEAAVTASLGRFDGDPLIFDADLDRLRVFFESQGIPIPFAVPSDVDDTVQRNGVDARPLVEVVCTELAATLHLGDSESIDATASLIDLGLDSLLALDLRRRLRRTVGHSAPVARMLGGITVNELIDVLGATDGQDMGKVGIHA